MNKIKNIVNKEEKGSITVEAAFVMPIVVLTVFALIYLAFYLHDYNKIQGTVDLVIHKAGITVKHDADIATGRMSYEDISDRGVFYLLTGDSQVEEHKIGELLGQELSKGLFITYIINTEVEACKLDIKINVLAKTKIGLPLFQNLLNNLLNINMERTYPVHNPAETIRVCEVILDTGSKIKGVDKLKDVIEKFIKTK